jgi:hypothetical protein
MSTGHVATVGVALGAAGIALGQAWLVLAVVALVAGTALGIRYRFRRGRTPYDI